MRGIEEFREAARFVLAMSPADQTEMVFLDSDDHLTRFANNDVHQNVAESNIEVRVRVVVGARVGVSVANSLTHSTLQATIESAIQLAQAQPENAEWPGLPEPVRPTDVPGFSEATASASPRIRARGWTG